MQPCSRQPLSRYNTCLAWSNCLAEPLTLSPAAVRSADCRAAVQTFASLRPLQSLSTCWGGWSVDTCMAMTSSTRRGSRATELHLCSHRRSIWAFTGLLLCLKGSCLEYTMNTPPSRFISVAHEVCYATRLFDILFEVLSLLITHFFPVIRNPCSSTHFQTDAVAAGCVSMQGANACGDTSRLWWNEGVRHWRPEQAPSELCLQVQPRA